MDQYLSLFCETPEYTLWLKYTAIPGSKAIDLALRFKPPLYLFFYVLSL